jgi:uncharacterized PurR-regulated membrane protein YhhQ (DUF165 family)
MQLKTIVYIAAFAATIPTANWMIGHVGACSPSGPCVIPVGFGLFAPSGVLMIGAALVLRDAVQEASGIVGAVLAILAGALISWFLSPPFLVIASVSAFALAELADLAVYSPLRERNMSVAVLASGLVGSLIDSAVFLYLAFGSLDFILGQAVGKIWVSLLAAVVIFAVKRRRALA